MKRLIPIEMTQDEMQHIILALHLIARHLRGFGTETGSDDIAAISQYVAGLEDLFTTISQRQEKEDRMKKFSLLIVGMFLLLGFTGLRAQDAAPTLTPEIVQTAAAPVEPTSTLTLTSTLPYITVVAIVLLVCFTYLFKEVVVRLALLAPQWAIEALAAGEQRVYQDAKKYVATTPLDLDDKGLEDLQSQINTILEEVRKRRGEAEEQRVNTDDLKRIVQGVDMPSPLAPTVQAYNTTVATSGQVLPPPAS